MYTDHRLSIVYDSSNFKANRSYGTFYVFFFNLQAVRYIISGYFSGRTIQQSEHCSIEDCLASLDLYKEVRMDWEHKLIEKERRQLAHQNDIFDKIPGEKVLDMLETQSHEKGDANVDESCSTKTYLSDEFWPQYLFPNSNE